MNAFPTVLDVPALFQDDLIELEKILWTGRPGPKPFIGWDLMAVPFGLVILGFCIVFILGTSGLLSRDHKLQWTGIFGLATIPFFKVGFGIAIEPFISRIWKIPNTYYAITNQRLLILRTKPKRTMHALYIKDISDSKNIVSADGHGTIAFIGNPSQLGKKLFEDIYFCFSNIQDVSSVDQLINDLRKHI